MLNFFCKIRIATVFVMLLSACSLKAQDIAVPLTWTVDSLVDLSTNDHFAYTCTFKTNGTNSIIWIQNGDFVSTVQIVSTSGSWGNIMEYGKVVHSISYEGETGSLTLERDATGAQIILELSQTGSTTLRQKFIVSAITQIP